MEDTYLGKATERLFLPLMRLTLPELVDMDLPKEGGFHNCALVSMDKRYPLHARKVMHALWGAGQMQFCKCIVVLDADVDVHDYAQVAWRVFNNVDWKRDVTGRRRARWTCSTTRPRSRSGGPRSASTPPGKARLRATTASGRPTWRCRRK